jgi:hypothetical protein
MTAAQRFDDSAPHVDGAYQSLDDLNHLGLTCTVEEAGRVLGMSRAAAYKAAQHFRENGGSAGLPVLPLGQRRMVVPVPALRDMLATGKLPTMGRDVERESS